MTITDDTGKFLYNANSNITITIQPSSAADIDRFSALPVACRERACSWAAVLQAAQPLCSVKQTRAAQKSLQSPVSHRHM